MCVCIYMYILLCATTRAPIRNDTREISSHNGNINIDQGNIYNRFNYNTNIKTLIQYDIQLFVMITIKTMIIMMIIIIIMIIIILIIMIIIILMIKIII